MRADRLLSILLLLQGRGRMTAAALAERLEVSERTIYRDLDALSAAGVPVYAERGRHGGCVLRPGYRTDLSGLNAAEVESLFAGTAGRWVDEIGLGPGLRSALAKLESGLPLPRRDDADRARGRIYVDPAPWFAPGERTQLLPRLRQAVLEARVVELRYRREDGREARRRAEPLGLVVKGGVWYLVAATAAGMRVHRVSRLRRVAVADERFERPPDFDLGEFWRRWSRELVERIPEYRVRLRLSREGMRVLPQILGERVRHAIEAAGRGGRRGVEIELTFDDLHSACGAVLHAGRLVEALEPPELRTAVRAAAERIAAAYRP